ARHRAEARSLPRPLARARAPALGRALRRPRRVRPPPRRRRARRGRGLEDAGRGQPRAGTHPSPRDPGARARMTYFADVAALARKDILLELRSRDTLPAMLLFVVSALVVFHFSLPSDASDTASTGLLWIALLFTALLGLGRAFTAEREQRVLDGLVLAPYDRSAIWLAKRLGVLVFLGVAEVVALPAYALFFEPVGWELVAAILLANLGLAAVGALLAAIACPSRAGARLP